MNKLRVTLVTVMATAMSIFVSSCTQEELSPTTPDQNSNAISAATRAQLNDVGFMDLSDLRITGGPELLNPEYEAGHYLLEGDIIITKENLSKMVQSEVAHVGPVGEQYRTNNLVSSPRTIRVIGYTGGSFALDNTMRTALQWAINNYNRLNIGLNFTLTFGTNYQAYDMVVYKVSGSGGGSAGFPSGGDPYQFVQIQSGTSSFGTNVTEHVITHEIGHSIGFRHTDFFNRSLSCGQGGNEGDGGVGAIYIPGTPTGFDTNSIMLACFSSNEDGEFGSYDITALEYLY